MTERGPDAPENAIFSSGQFREGLRTLQGEWAGCSPQERLEATGRFVRGTLERAGYAPPEVVMDASRGIASWNYREYKLRIADEVFLRDDPTTRVPNDVEESATGNDASSFDLVLHEMIHAFDDLSAGRQVVDTPESHAQIARDAERWVDSAVGAAPVGDSPEQGTRAEHVPLDYGVRAEPPDVSDASPPNEPGPDGETKPDAGVGPVRADDAGIDRDAGFESDRAGAAAEKSGEPTPAGDREPTETERRDR